MRNLRIILIILVLVSLLRSETGEPDHKVPLFLSFVFPGGGQIYNGRYIKAAVYGALEGVLIYGAWQQDRRLDKVKDDLAYYREIDDFYKIREYEYYVDRYRNERNNFIWMSAAAVLLSAGDAFVDSHFKSFKRDVFRSGDELSLEPAGAGLKIVYQW
jgi:TM2 domain-containing membrane protein YozV